MTLPGFLDDSDGEVNPLASMANLFDVAMVFAVALMVALVSFLQLPALLQDKDYTVITNPGKEDMEIIVKEGEEIKHYEASGRGWSRPWGTARQGLSTPRWPRGSMYRQKACRKHRPSSLPLTK